MRAHEVITELYGTYDLRTKPISNLAELEELMQSLGFQVLDGGEYSLVFTREGMDQVVKVYNDACYDSFIKFCKEHPNNPYLPKFRGNGVRINSKARMIRIERLTPLPRQASGASGPEFAQLQLLYNISKNPNPEDLAMWDLDDEKKAIIDTFAALRAYISDGCRLDIHDANIMMRGKTPVIIDPFSDADADGWASGVI